MRMKLFSWLLPLLLVNGCMWDGKGWEVYVETGRVAVGATVQEKIVGRDYTFKTTFDGEGMDILTGAIMNLRPDALVECDEATGMCVVTSKTDLTLKQFDALVAEAANATVVLLGDGGSPPTEVVDSD